MGDVLDFRRSPAPVDRPGAGLLRYSDTARQAAEESGLPGPKPPREQLAELRAAGVDVGMLDESWPDELLQDGIIELLAVLTFRQQRGQ